MLIDTHCHLDAAEYDADRDAVARRALDAGVERIIVPSVAAFNFHATVDCRRYPGVEIALGIHPMYVHVHKEEHLAQLEEAIRAQKPVAIGEIGLDRFQSCIERPGVFEDDLPRQEFYFVEQLKLAKKHGLPVLLHIRRANDQILKYLHRIKVPGGIAHAFNGSMQQAHEFIKLGFKLGFGGAFTYSRATNLRRLAMELPLDSIVLETDGPDIPPEWIARRRNEPAEIPRIALTLATLRGVSVDEIASVTSENARKLLRLDG
ncbi:MAG: TatD family hydrolase [Hydrogenophilaceae bacterium]|nr:TatD family hydrolase [Hydrogenophilaceae bacterium]